MKKYSRAQCLQVVFKWFSKKCIYIPQERAYKMLTIGESKWRVWSCLLYYFFQRFKFEMFPNTKVWREVHARKDSQIPRLPSLIALTPDQLTKRGIFSQLSSTPAPPPQLAHHPPWGVFVFTLTAVNIRLFFLGGSGWGTMGWAAGRARSNGWKQALPHNAMGQLRKPAVWGLPESPTCLPRRVPNCKRRNPPTDQKLFLTNLSHPFWIL